MAHWIDETRLGNGPELGKVTYRHAHDDNTSHPCKITPLTQSGAWGGTPGQYNPDVRIQCLNCGAVLAEGDEIQTKVSGGE